ALSENGFVTRGDCQDQTGCTYSWHDLAGAEGTRRERMIGVTASLTSPDGRRALLVALDDVTSCLQDGDSFPIYRGTEQLLDLATGAVQFELQLRTNRWSALAFTSTSDWFFLAPNGDTACVASTLGLRSATAPFGPAPGLAGAE